MPLTPRKEADMMRQTKFGLITTTIAVAVNFAAWAADTWADELDKSFEMPGEKSIMAAKDCGLVNGLLSVNGWIEDVAEVRRVHAPPYFCDDLIIKFKFNGKPVPAARNVWRPEVLTREGALDGWRIVTRLYPLAGGAQYRDVLPVLVRSRYNPLDIGKMKRTLLTGQRCAHLGEHDADIVTDAHRTTGTGCLRYPCPFPRLPQNVSVLDQVLQGALCCHQRNAKPLC